MAVTGVAEKQGMIFDPVDFYKLGTVAVDKISRMLGSEVIILENLSIDWDICVLITGQHETPEQNTSRNKYLRIRLMPTRWNGT